MKRVLLCLTAAWGLLGAGATGLAARAAASAHLQQKPAAGGAAAVGAPRKSAEALFARYIDLEHAFDPALVDLYADSARIESRVIVVGRPPTVRTWSGAQYKDLLRRALQKAKEKKQDLNYYSAINYLAEGGRVRIRAMRYAELQKAVSPVELLVGPDASGTWRIFEELSESHPITPPPSSPPRS
jgi:hypothetical protein